MTDKHVCAENADWHLNLQHFGDTNIKYLEVNGHCSICKRQIVFRWPAGLNPSAPTVAVDGSEAIFPFLFEGEDYDGRAMGYSVSTAAPN